MSKTLKGRVALVTGGGRGIGRAIVEVLHAEGASVVIADHGTGIDGSGSDPTVARELAGKLGERAAAFTESIASPSISAAAVAFAVERFGGLDILVNNAAILRDAFIFKADPLAWEAVLRTNLSGAFYTLAAATPVLRDQAKAGRGGAPYAWGRIVNIVSTAAFYGNYGQAAYASAKAGLMGLTRVTALDMQRSAVTCNAIAPFAATRVTESIQPANPGQAAYKERALKIGAHHVANLVTALCTPAAKSITGQLLGVRGREVFLFGQPRPVAKLEVDKPEQLASDLIAKLGAKFTDMTTDLEAFNTEPLV